MSSDSEVLVKVENVSKKFCRDLKRSLWYGVKDIASEMTGQTINHDELRKDEFWAVKDVSFELRRGECLGLIGHNGAGKSTLLKMLNGLIKPDKGKINIKGRVGALIELGAGFNPILTGRENVYVNGQILGFTRKEIDAKFNDIVEFAEIRDFIDTPVQNYSSGMKVRLGFGVAAQMEPDVLLIDEVLAVGDVGFQVKCFNTIQEISNNSAVILVSHSMPNIARVADKVILMKEGYELLHGQDVTEAVNLYFNQFDSEKYIEIGKSVQILELTITNGREKNSRQFMIFDDLNISFKISEVEFDEGYYKVLFLFFDSTLRQFAQYTTEDIKFDGEKNDYTKIELFVKRLNFNSGKYQLAIAFYKKTGARYSIFNYQKNIYTLEMHSNNHITNAIISLDAQYEIT